jgi:hypothetical protein
MLCRVCGDDVDERRWFLGFKLCLRCGEEQARQDRRGWTILTPHKQGAMFFTAQTAREAAQGINNKGGLVK